MRPYHTTAARIREYARRSSYVDPGAIAIDTRALAAFRVLAGSLIVADVLLRARNFGFLYTEEGVVPQSLAMEAAADDAFSVYYLTTDPLAIAGLFALTVVIAIQLIVGYRTRVATVLSFLLVVSLDHHNPLVTSYADVLFRLLLFWAVFLPLGERWSVDALHADSQPKERVTGLASAAILTQIVYMYVVNGYHKRESELWTGGEATPLVMGLDNTTFLLGEFTRNVPTLLQYGGLTWYYMLLFSWLLVLLRGRARTALVAMFVAGHASFAITVRIGAFPYVSIAGLLLFLQAPFWDGLRSLSYTAVDRSRLSSFRDGLVRHGSRLPDFRVGSERLRGTETVLLTVVLVGAVVSVLVVPALSLLPVAGFLDEDDGPGERIDDTAAILGVDQPEWSVFAPSPRTSDRYYVFPAVTEGGETVDAYNERSLAYDRPYGELQRQFGTYRERFYMNSVRDGDAAAVALADHLCERWEEDHGEGLTHLNMYYIEEDVTLETIDDSADRDREIRPVYYHACGDADPIAIDSPA